MFKGWDYYYLGISQDPARYGKTSSVAGNWLPKMGRLNFDELSVKKKYSYILLKTFRGYYLKIIKKLDGWDTNKYFYNSMKTYLNKNQDTFLLLNLFELESLYV